MSKLGPNFKLGTLLFVLVFGLSTAALYGGTQLVYVEKAASADADGGEAPSGPVTVTIVGKNILFETRSVTAAAGAEVTVTFDNEDAGVLHNIHFFANRNRSASLAQSPVKPGPAQDVVKFTAPSAPGNYPFICDVHPDTMTGNLVVR
ncbi:MAG: cupredoxin domain-containing protein [Dehalococcoidia bacterium]